MTHPQVEAHACHEKFVPPKNGSPQSKYFEIFGQGHQIFLKYLDLLRNIWTTFKRIELGVGLFYSEIFGPLLRELNLVLDYD